MQKPSFLNDTRRETIDAMATFHLALQITLNMPGASLTNLETELLVRTLRMQAERANVEAALARRSKTIHDELRPFLK